MAVTPRTRLYSVSAVILDSWPTAVAFLTLKQLKRRHEPSGNPLWPRLGSNRVIRSPKIRHKTARKRFPR